MRSLLCEGGPTLMGALLHERLVDELFLTLAPQLAGGGTGPTMSSGPALADPAALELVWALERAGSLYLRYARAAQLVSRAMRIACGFDHAGVPLRDAVVAALERDGHAVVDAGTYDDYPYAAAAVARALDGETPSGRCSCAAPAPACRSRRPSCPACVQRPSTTGTRPIRASSTTTSTCCASARA